MEELYKVMDDLLEVEFQMKAGMETCWFCREKMEESELENVRRTHKADHVIKRLEELKDLL